MNKKNYINKDFFKSHQNTILAMGLLSGVILAGSIAYQISDSQYLFSTAAIKNSREPGCICEYEPLGIDKIVWDDEYENEEPKVYHTNFLDSNIVKARVFRGTSKSTHYRIEFIGDNLWDRDVSEWQDLPENNIIIFNIQDIPEEKRYNNYLCIRFGTYNPELYVIEKNNVEYFASTPSSQELMKEHEKMHEQIMSIADKLVEGNDADFVKTKKIYDYLISHTEYRYLEEGIYNRSIFNKYYMDCVGYAEFMDIALNSVGVESFLVADDTHAHVWNLVKINDKWYHLDATYSDTSSWYDTSKYRYFLVSDEFMLADHRFFVSEIDVKCDEVYDLTGIVSERDVVHRGFKGEEINLIAGGHKIGEPVDSGYSLNYCLK